MKQRYTLTECYEVLQVDPKTFRRWMEKANITPQVSKADDRVKYLTQEQLRELAEQHERELSEAVPTTAVALPPGAYKLLLDQVDELRDLVRQTHEESLAHTNNYVAHLEDLQRLYEREQQQHDRLAELVADQWRLMREHQQELAEQISREATVLSASVRDLEARLHTQELEMQRSQETSTSAREQLSAALREELSQHRAAIGTTLAEQKQKADQLAQMGHDLAARQTEALQRHWQQIAAAMERQARERDDALHTLNREVAADLAAFTGTMEQVETQVRTLMTSTEAAMITALGALKRDDKQDEQIARLSAQLAQEREERFALAEQVAQLVAPPPAQPPARPPGAGRTRKPGSRP
jgi:hypothetical protein